MAIPDVILHHPGALDTEARAQMQQRVLHGAALAQQLSFLPRSAHDVNNRPPRILGRQRLSVRTERREHSPARPHFCRL